MRDDQFWTEHYTKFREQQSSPFCKFCVAKVLRPTDTVVEIGCGNGRDSVEIARNVARYIGLDTCPTAVNACATLLATNNLTDGRATVLVENGARFDFGSVEAKDRLALYSRFSLHSMSYADQAALLERLSLLAPRPWVCMVEARTIHDELYGVGENVGPHEFVTDHYRRFIDPKSFLSELLKSFHVHYFELAKGFAAYKDEDPLVMRVVFSGQPR